MCRMVPSSLWADEITMVLSYHRGHDHDYHCRSPPLVWSSRPSRWEGHFADAGHGRLAVRNEVENCSVSVLVPALEIVDSLDSADVVVATRSTIRIWSPLLSWRSVVVVSGMCVVGRMTTVRIFSVGRSVMLYVPRCSKPHPSEL